MHNYEKYDDPNDDMWLCNGCGRWLRGPAYCTFKNRNLFFCGGCNKRIREWKLREDEIDIYEVVKCPVEEGEGIYYIVVKKEATKNENKKME